MLKKSFAVIIAAVTLATGVQPASAFGPGGYARDLSQVAVAPSFAKAKYTAVGFIRPAAPDFLHTASIADKAVMKMTPYKRSLIFMVNQSVNKEQAGDVPQTFGSNGMFINISFEADPAKQTAIAKRQKLIAMGIPASAMKIGTKLSRANGDHAVLVVKTDRGTVVLDNTTDRLQVLKTATR